MHDLLTQAVFYIFAGIALISGLMVVTQNNPVRCVLFLVLTFFACAVLWLLESAEFLALVLILVYVGAVMTLFLFVVMMLDIDVESITSHLVRRMPFGLIVVALLTGLLMVAVPESWFDYGQLSSAVAQPIKQSNTEAIGLALFTDYLFAFELAAIILLTAIVAAIILAHRMGQYSKKQNIKKQIMVKRRDRVRLVSMRSEKR
jgi:NADH-quinone oxidoreductase subunit J